MPAATSALNTVQRLGSSIGSAMLAVVLQRTISAEVPAIDGAALGPMSPAERVAAAAALADAFGSTFWVALALITVAVLPAVMLPRRREQPREAAELKEV